MKSRLMVVCALVLTIACGKSTTEPSGNGSSSSSGSSGSGSSGGAGGSGGTGSGGGTTTTGRSLTATIDGQSWVGTVSSAVNISGAFAIAGTNAAGLAFSFGAPAVQGTTSVGLLSGTNAALAQGTQNWQAAVTNGERDGEHHVNQRHERHGNVQLHVGAGRQAPEHQEIER